jgi:hypothetical protein
VPPPISKPSGITSDKMTSTIAKQRSARLHRFQSEIQSCMSRCPPVTLAPSAEIYMTDQHEKISTEVWLYDDKGTVMSP